MVIIGSAKLSSTFTIPEELSSYFSFRLDICLPNHTWWSYVIFALLQQGSKPKFPSVCMITGARHDLISFPMSHTASLNAIANLLTYFMEQSPS